MISFGKQHQHGQRHTHTHTHIFASLQLRMYLSPKSLHPELSEGHAKMEAQDPHSLPEEGRPQVERSATSKSLKERLEELSNNSDSPSPASRDVSLGYSFVLEGRSFK